ncbi:hypothetical protein MTR67_044011 [Solanum verrucosum]|uniref:Uncharacterized protein n=1 Tax=Solanum verrucosum TaxID=315347 RepID=A0AAF0ZT71_SOLVR|nr:hypothetical protein MTR67_044011 [Solanum verrucosum]
MEAWNLEQDLEEGFGLGFLRENVSKYGRYVLGNVLEMGIELMIWVDLVMLDITDLPKLAKIISSIRAMKLIGQGCLAYLYYVRNVEVESLPIEYAPLVSEFKEVFRTDLRGMPPDRDIDICIDLETGTLPISIPRIIWL